MALKQERLISLWSQSRIIFRNDFLFWHPWLAVDFIGYVNIKKLKKVWLCCSFFHLTNLQKCKRTNSFAYSDCVLGLHIGIFCYCASWEPPLTVVWYPKISIALVLNHIQRFFFRSSTELLTRKQSPWANCTEDLILCHTSGQTVIVDTHIFLFVLRSSS